MWFKLFNITGFLALKLLALRIINLRINLSDVYPMKLRVADSPEERFHRGAASTFWETDVRRFS
jgi:hypothetical protein